MCKGTVLSFCRQRVPAACGLVPHEEACISDEGSLDDGRAVADVVLDAISQIFCKVTNGVVLVRASSLIAQSGGGEAC